MGGFFSSCSDVWSFGVVMWEIFSFGADPYSEYTGREVSKFVTNGHRLLQPDGCSDPVYHVMRECWSTLPESRPTFMLLDEILRAQILDQFRQRLNSVGKTSSRDVNNEILQQTVQQVAATNPSELPIVDPLPSSNIPADTGIVRISSTRRASLRVQMSDNSPTRAVSDVDHRQKAEEMIEPQPLHKKHFDASLRQTFV